MTNYNFGDILLLRFPYSEGVGEYKRPVVLLAETDVEDIVVKITSAERKGKYDIIIDDWQSVGLLFPSIIRIDKIATLSKSRVTRKIGVLGNQYNSRIKDKIKQLFNIE